MVANRQVDMAPRRRPNQPFRKPTKIGRSPASERVTIAGGQFVRRHANDTSGQTTVLGTCRQAAVG